MSKKLDYLQRTNDKRFSPRQHQETKNHINELENELENESLESFLDSFDKVAL